MKHEFDKFSDGYSEIVAQAVSFSGLRHDFFLAAKAELLSEVFVSHFTKPRDISVLDVGCGIGLLHPWLERLVGRVTGADPSADSIERARLANPGISYSVEDGRAMKFADGGFDVALAVTALHHVPPDDWNVFVSEMHRVVRPGGLVAIIEHNPFNPFTRLAVARCPLDESAVLLTARQGSLLLRNAGCAGVRHRYFLFLPTPAKPFRTLETYLSSLPLGAQFIAIGEV